MVKLPETGWQKELDALEHLIVDKGILEKDVTEIDLRSPTHYFFVLQEWREKRVEQGKGNLMGETLRLRVNNEIPAYRTGLVAALDVGTSKVACVIGRAEQGTLKILGSGLARKRRPQGRHRHQPGPGGGIASAIASPPPRTMPTPASRMC